MSTRLFSRQKGVQHTVKGATFVPSAAGVGVIGTLRDAVSAAGLLTQFKELTEVGQIFIRDETAAGNGSENFEVPTGKYWRLLAMVHVLVTSGDVADRAVVVATRTAANAAIETLTHVVVAANQTAQRTTAFGSADWVTGNLGVAAVGKITIAEPVTTGDTFTIGTTEYTLLSAASATVPNQILMGATEATTKTAIAAAVSGHPLVTCPAEFSGDDLLVTARRAGTAGNAIVFIEDTLTHGSNVLDGSGVLGGTTSGVNPADILSALDYPAAGPLLTPGEDVHVTVTAGVAGDTLTTFLIGLQYDYDPR